MTLDLFCNNSNVSPVLLFIFCSSFSAFFFSSFSFNSLICLLNLYFLPSLVMPKLVIISSSVNPKKTSGSAMSCSSSLGMQSSKPSCLRKVSTLLESNSSFAFSSDDVADLIFGPLSSSSSISSLS